MKAMNIGEVCTAVGGSILGGSKEEVPPEWECW